MHIENADAEQGKDTRAARFNVGRGPLLLAAIAASRRAFLSGVSLCQVAPYIFRTGRTSTRPPASRIGQPWESSTACARSFASTSV